MKKSIPVIKGKKYIIDIVSMGHSGEGVGRYEDFTVFVQYGIIGETVEVLVTEVKKTYAKGKLVNIIKKSPNRVIPKCDIYYKCGGCQLQHMDYEKQLEVKRQQVVDAIERIGRQQDVLVRETIGMKNPWNYRNKMQFPIKEYKGEIAVGCYAQGTHDVINTEDCLIQKEANNQIANVVRNAVQQLNISVYDEKAKSGVLRHVIGRVGSFSREVMVVLVTNEEIIPKQEEFIEILKENIPGLVSIVQNINSKDTNVIMGDRTKTLWGKDTIADKLGEFSFDISAKSFFQVNTKQAEVLYNKTLEYARLRNKGIVIDAYCGTGTITLFLAQKAEKVYGIEIVEAAIEDARKNAEFNSMENTEFITGDVIDAMEKLYKEGIEPGVIVTDPPRAGCDKAVLETFAKIRTKRIVYVSCNPASLARDIAILAELGYKTKEIQPVDMFCQTSHVECVAIIKRMN